MNLVDEWRETLARVICYHTVRVFCLRKNLAFSDLSTVEIVDVLSDEDALDTLCLMAPLLELSDRFVTRVRLLSNHELVEVPVPFPNSHRVFVEHLTS